MLVFNLLNGFGLAHHSVCVICGDPMRFENQIAIVTGAGRGIGHAIAVRLANEGARVACVSRTEANAKKTADEINAMRAGRGKGLRGRCRRP